MHEVWKLHFSEILAIRISIRFPPTGGTCMAFERWKRRHSSPARAVGLCQETGFVRGSWEATREPPVWLLEAAKAFSSYCPVSFMSNLLKFAVAYSFVPWFISSWRWFWLQLWLYRLQLTSHWHHSAPSAGYTFPFSVLGFLQHCRCHGNQLGPCTCMQLRKTGREILGSQWVNLLTFHPSGR